MLAVRSDDMAKGARRAELLPADNGGHHPSRERCHAFAAGAAYQ